MNDPTAVVMWLDSGDVIEEPFATRFQAELFVAMLPGLVLPDGVRVTAAILSPLLPHPMELMTPKTGN